MPIHLACRHVDRREVVHADQSVPSNDGIMGGERDRALIGQRMGILVEVHRLGVADQR